MMVNFLRHCLNISLDDFFAIGGNSLNVIEVVGKCVVAGIPLTPVLLYRHSTLEALCRHLSHQKNPQSDARSSRSLIGDTFLEEATNHMIDLHESLPRTCSGKILFTGATGFFGCRLLCELLRTTKKSIVCLVRCSSPSDGLCRIKSALSSQLAVLPKEAEEKLEILNGDIGVDTFGLDTITYEKLLKDVDEVYHGAAVVNVVLPYEKLFPVNVRGVSHILKFCLTGSRKKLHYMSTLSVFVGSDRKCALALESDDLSEECNLYGGYAQTKWVAERMLLNASKKGMRGIVIYRLGLITGDTENGRMKETDLLSAVLRNIKNSGRVPVDPNEDNPMSFDWTPVDYAAKLVTAIACNHIDGLHPQVFHVAGETPVTLNEVVALLQERGVEVETVPREEWEEHFRSCEAMAYVGLSRALDKESYELFRALDIFQSTGIKFDQANTRALLREIQIQLDAPHHSLLGNIQFD